MHEDVKSAAFVIPTMGTPVVTASLLLAGFFAYSLFPTLLISMLRFPTAILSVGVNLLTMGLTVRWRLLEKLRHLVQAGARLGRNEGSRVLVGSQSGSMAVPVGGAVARHEATLRAAEER